MDEDDLVSRLIAAADRASSWADASAGLRKDLKENESDELRWLIWAFDYGLDSWRHGELSAKDPFVPMLGYNDGSSYPAALELVEEEAIAVWESVADADGPVASSRLHDLLWERRSGNEPYLHAKAAWGAYVDLARGSWEAIYRSVCLVRALQLARSLNDPDLVSRTTRLAVAFVLGELPNEGALPGASFHVLEALVDLPKEARPPELDGLLDRAEGLFGDDASLFESVAQMKMNQAGSPEDLASLRMALIDRWLETAKGAGSLARFAHLRHALELAEAYELTERGREIRALIQESPADQDAFHEVSVEFKIPRAEIDGYVGALTGDDSWQDALTRLGAMPAPSGDHSANLALVQQQMADHPLLFLITKVIYGPHGFPIQEVKDEDLHVQIALSEQELLGIGLGGLIVGNTLDAIKDRYGVPSKEELTGFFTAAFIPEETAERVAASLLHYWEGRLDECVHVLCPRIEATLRTGLMRIGMTIMRLPMGKRPGGVRALGELLREALTRDVFRDVSRTRYLYNLLCDPYGMNLRNAIAHGFLTKALREDAALLIQAIAYLRLLGVGGDEGQS